MKTKLATFIVLAVALVSLSLPESIGSSPKSDKTPATLQEMHAELKKTQTELEQTLPRIAALEQQVRSLQQANAKLEQEIKRVGQPRLVPLESK